MQIRQVSRTKRHAPTHAEGRGREGVGEEEVHCLTPFCETMGKCRLKTAAICGCRSLAAAHTHTHRQAHIGTHTDTQTMPPHTCDLVACRGILQFVHNNHDNSNRTHTETHTHTCTHTHHLHMHMSVYVCMSCPWGQGAVV